MAMCSRCVTYVPGNPSTCPSCGSPLGVEEGRREIRPAPLPTPVRCPRCGNQLASTASDCARCGQARIRYGWLLGLGIAGVLLTCLGLYELLRGEGGGSSKSGGPPLANGGDSSRSHAGTQPTSTPPGWSSGSWPESAGTLDAEEVLKRYGSGVVVVRTKRAQGSGFYIHPGGLLVTNRHVVAEDRWVSVTWEKPAGTRAPLEGKVLFSDPQLDIAFILASSPEVVPLPLDWEEEAVRGRRVVAMGFPLASRFGDERVSISSGMILGVGEVRDLGVPGDLIRIDAVVSPGNSGGPLWDLSTGRVVGIVFAKAGSLSDAAGNSFAIPIQRLLQRYPGLRSGGENAEEYFRGLKPK